MSWSLVHTDRCKGLPSADWWCLWPIWATTGVSILAPEGLARIIRKVALIARIRPTTLVFLTVNISLIIDFTTINGVLLLSLLFIRVADASMAFSGLDYDFIGVRSLASWLVPHTFGHMLRSLFLLIAFEARVAATLLQITTIIVLSFVVKRF